jgi:hypothetical protein
MHFLLLLVIRAENLSKVLLSKILDIPLPRKNQEYINLRRFALRNTLPSFLVLREEKQSALLLEYDQFLKNKSKPSPSVPLDQISFQLNKFQDSLRLILMASDYLVIQCEKTTDFFALQYFRQDKYFKESLSINFITERLNFYKFHMNRFGLKSDFPETRDLNSNDLVNRLTVCISNIETTEILDITFQTIINDAYFFIQLNGFNAGSLYIFGSLVSIKSEMESAADPYKRMTEIINKALDASDDLYYGKVKKSVLVDWQAKMSLRKIVVILEMVTVNIKEIEETEEILARSDIKMELSLVESLLLQLIHKKGGRMDVRDKMNASVVRLSSLVAGIPRSLAISHLLETINTVIYVFELSPIDSTELLPSQNSKASEQQSVVSRLIQRNSRMLLIAAFVLFFVYFTFSQKF